MHEHGAAPHACMSEYARLIWFQHRSTHMVPAHFQDFPNNLDVCEQEQLRNRGLRVGSKKAELVSRLVDAVVQVRVMSCVFTQRTRSC